jgi:hypothetical protein
MIGRPWLMLLAVLPTAGSLLSAPTAQQPTFRSRTDAVTVPVSVMKGHDPAAGLSSADFELTDNGVRQRIDVASLETVPIDVTLAITGGHMQNERGIVQGGLQMDRVRALLRPTDRLRAVEIGAVIRGRLVPVDRAFYGSEGPKTSVIPGVALVDGVFYALAWPVDPDRRHLVILFTEGSGRWSTLPKERLADLASRSDAVLHMALWASPNDNPARLQADPTTNLSQSLAEMRGPAPSVDPEWRETYRALDDAVRRTGGTVRPLSDSFKAFADILEDFRSSYVLQYTPQGVSAPGWHELKVKVTRSGSFTIRARRGYSGS